MNINWYGKAFNNLTPDELYQVMRLRSEVFVVEQNCVFLDADNKDQQCLHFMGWIENDLVAYTRLSPPGYIYKEPSIGRVVTAPAYRKNKIGYVLTRIPISLPDNPLDYIRQAKSIIDRKKLSLESRFSFGTAKLTQDIFGSKVSFFFLLLTKGYYLLIDMQFKLERNIIDIIYNVFGIN